MKAGCCKAKTKKEATCTRMRKVTSFFNALFKAVDDSVFFDDVFIMIGDVLAFFKHNIYVIVVAVCSTALWLFSFQRYHDL